MAKAKKKEDVSAEEKIKQAARKLFTEKGFDAVKTRDIAAEAGINLALLNYYFRSKEKLFDIIMLENFEQFIQQLIPVFTNEKLSVDETITQVTAQYIDMYIANPGLPFFVLNEMRSNSPKLQPMREKLIGVREKFFSHIEKNLGKNKFTSKMKTHFMINFMGLMIFPFLGQPILMRVNGVNKAEFNALMEERKQLIPIWIKAMMNIK